jgi:hypothetical protein
MTPDHEVTDTELSHRRLPPERAKRSIGLPFTITLYGLDARELTRVDGGDVMKDITYARMI